MSAADLLLFAAGGTGSSGTETVSSPTNIAAFAVVIGSIVLFGGAAVLAFGWAFRNGQFENFDRSAASIFGPDEPIDEPTDAFPK